MSSKILFSLQVASLNRKFSLQMYCCKTIKLHEPLLPKTMFSAFLWNKYFRRAKSLNEIHYLYSFDQIYILYINLRQSVFIVRFSIEQIYLFEFVLLYTTKMHYPLLLLFIVFFSSNKCQMYWMGRYFILVLMAVCAFMYYALNID